MRRFSWSALVLPLPLAICGLAPAFGQSPVTRDIAGQVRLGSQPAPAGIPVVLQIVSSRYATASTEAEVAHTVTDRKGNFVFEHLETLGKDGGREFLAVSARSTGYSRGWQVVDLTFATHGEVKLVLEKAPLPPQGAAGVSEGAADATADHPRRPLNAEATEALSRGRELLFRKQDPAASVDEFKKAVKSEPWYGPGYILLGLAYMQLQRWADAEWTFTEASKVEPASVQAYMGMGSAMTEQHNYAGAEKALTHALDLNPDSAEAHYELARTYASLEKWDEAAPHALRSIEINPDYAGPHALMGNIYLMQQDLPFALAEFQEYLRLDPQSSLAPSVKETIAEIQKSLADQAQKHP